MKKKRVVIIIGPTAVGKTALSINLAQQFNGAVISGDSMQIYRHLDIGTAKVTPQEMADIPHYLINIRDVQQKFTVYEFQKAAYQLINQINQQQKLPLVVGGTGFYIKSLVANLNLGGKNSHLQPFRQQYTQLLTTKGPQYLWDLLQQQDPQAAANIAPQNTRRVIRALEVGALTGAKFSQQPQYDVDFDYLIIGLTTSRTLLYQRINQRVDLMMTAGLEQEAYWLYQKRQQVPQAALGIGYKELFPYFAGQISKTEAVDLIKRNSRRFAKRQLTYFRHQLTVHWFDVLQHPEQIKQIKALIKKFKE